MIICLTGTDSTGKSSIVERVKELGIAVHEAPTREVYAKYGWEISDYSSLNAVERKILNEEIRDMYWQRFQNFIDQGIFNILFERSPLDYLAFQYQHLWGGDLFEYERRVTHSWVKMRQVVGSVGFTVLRLQSSKSEGSNWSKMIDHEYNKLSPVNQLVLDGDLDFKTSKIISILQGEPARMQS